MSPRAEATNVVLGIASGSAFSVLLLASVLATGRGDPRWSAVAIGYTVLVLIFSLYAAASVVSLVRAKDSQVRLARADRTMPVVIGYAILLGIGCIGVIPAAFVVWRCMRLREALQALAMREASQPAAAGPSGPLPAPPSEAGP